MQIGQPGGLFASIDGKDVDHPEQYREVTGLLPFSMGPVQGGSLAAALGVPPGAELNPTKAAGYWLMIEGLELGAHTFHFGGHSIAFTSGNCCTPSVGEFRTDNTITITIVPEPQSELLIVMGLAGLAALRLVRRSI